MSFDAVVANPGRLQILTALAVEESQEFVQLRRSTQLSDGNLASHARRLESAGLIAVEKRFREGKPVTSFTLTADGRQALVAHTRRLVAAISHRRLTPTPLEPVRKQSKSIDPVPVAASVSEDWID